MNTPSAGITENPKEQQFLLPLKLLRCKIRKAEHRRLQRFPAHPAVRALQWNSLRLCRQINLKRPGLPYRQKAQRIRKQQKPARHLQREPIRQLLLILEIPEVQRIPGISVLRRPEIMRAQFRPGSLIMKEVQERQRVQRTLKSLTTQKAQTIKILRRLQKMQRIL